MKEFNLDNPLEGKENLKFQLSGLFSDPIIVEGKDDKEFYSNLFPGRVYTPTEFFNDVCKVDCCVGCGSKSCNYTEEKKIIDGHMGVIKTINYVKENLSDINIKGIIDRDFKSREKCYDCHNQIYFTRAFSLENNIIVNMQIFEFYVNSIKCENISLPNPEFIRENKFIPIFKKNFQIDYEEKSKSPRGYSETYLIKLYADFENIDLNTDKIKFIIENWYIRSSEVYSQYISTFNSYLKNNNLYVKDNFFKNVSINFNKLFDGKTSNDFIENFE